MVRAAVHATTLSPSRLLMCMLLLPVRYFDLPNTYNYLCYTWHLLSSYRVFCFLVDIPMFQYCNILLSIKPSNGNNLTAEYTSDCKWRLSACYYSSRNTLFSLLKKTREEKRRVEKTREDKRRDEKRRVEKRRGE